MSESSRFRVLLAVPGEGSGSRLEQACRTNNWEVTQVSASRQALKALEKKRGSAFHLFMADTRLKNFDILQVFTRARQLSPATRRLLIMEELPGQNETAFLLQAINDTRIDAVIPADISHEEQMRIAVACLEAALQDEKRTRMEEVTASQNKQMFKIAQRLKKKEAGLKERVTALKKERIRLSTKLQEAFQQKKDPSNLGRRMDAFDIPITVQALTRQFSLLARVAEIMFQHIAVDVDIEPLDILLGRLFSPDAGESGTTTSVPDMDPALEALKTRIMRTLYASPEDTDQFSSSFDPAPGAEQRELPDLVNLTISSDWVKAVICMNACSQEERSTITLSGILDLLRIKEIRFGIVEDEAIEAWMSSAAPGDAPFEIAVGTAQVPGKNGTVTYKFETSYTNPGKIMDDGRIDFRDRGAIPFVKKDDLLAQKSPALPGKDGMSISGEPIVVEEPIDPVFLAGTGTRLGEDGTSIYADTDGHPHLDPMGEITVSPELSIEGDIDYSTGNIDFNGHIVISGRVKEGFSVKGVSLTAREVEGASLDLSGDLCVSDGITDTEVASVGNIYAKFINNSTANAFGDIVVQKEIIDSQLLLSGTCQNPSGTVMGSKIAARNGVEAGRIGTPASEISQIRTGVEDHIRYWEEKLDSGLNISMEQMQDVKDEMEALEDQDQEIYAVIAQKSREQEKLSADIEELGTKLSEYRHRNNHKAVKQVQSELKSLTAKQKQIDQILNQCFDSHDKNLEKIEAKKTALEAAQARNKSIMLKKRGLKEFHLRTGHKAHVLAQQGITQGTIIMSPRASLTLETDQGRCKIQELSVSDEIGAHFELVISEP